MKQALITAAAFYLLACIPAHAAEPAPLDILSAPAPKVLQGMDETAAPTTAAIVEAVAAKEFCGHNPKGKAGSIVIAWERDEAGRCTVQTVRQIPPAKQ